MRRSTPLRFAVAGLCALAACGKDSPGPTDAGPHWPSVAAANAVPDSDPRAEGQYRFLYDAWGTEQQDSWPPAAFMVNLYKSEPAKWGEQFSNYGWIPDPNDDLPIGFKRGLVNANKVHETCAACHVAELPDGRLWLGAPNGKLDIEGFRLAVNEAWVAAGNPSMLSDVDIQKKGALGPGRTDAESGSYPQPVPAKFPPYYELGKRTRTNYLGTGRNLKTEAYLSIYTFGAGDPGARVPLPLPDAARLQAFLDFFGTIEPPTPPSQDADLVARGKQVFHEAQCDACHHPDDVAQDGVITVPADAGVPEYLPGENAAYPRGTIQTDPLHRILIAENSGGNLDSSTPDGGPGIDQGYLNLLDFISENGLAVGATDGYRVGYLRGLWARAPYLHNGSVPTLAALLSPASQRPTTFQVGSFTVDTTIAGNGNQGHEFGTALPDADKTALIAYLNSL